jgi:hypothetical protein
MGPDTKYAVIAVNVLLYRAWDLMILSNFTFQRSHCEALELLIRGQTGSADPDDFPGPALFELKNPEGLR